MEKTLLKLAVIFMSLLYVLTGLPVHAQDFSPLGESGLEAATQPVEETYERAVVLDVTTPSCPGDKKGGHKGKQTGASTEVLVPPGLDLGTMQQVTLRIDSGRLGGKEFTVTNTLGDNPAFNVPVKKGSRVVVSIDTFPDGTQQVYLADLERSPVLVMLFCAFLIALLFIGGRRPMAHFLLAGAVLWLTLNGVVFAMMLWEGSGALTALLGLLFVVWAGYFLGHPRQIPLKVFVISIYVCLAMLLLMMHGVMTLAPLHGFFDEGLGLLWQGHPRFDFEGLLHTCAALMGLGFVFYLAQGMMEDVAEKIPDAPEPLELSNLSTLLTVSGRRRLGPLLAILWLVLGGAYLPIAIQVMDLNIVKLVNLESVATPLAFLLVISLALVLSVPLLSFMIPRLLQEERKRHQPAAS